MSPAIPRREDFEIQFAGKWFSNVFPTFFFNPQSQGCVPIHVYEWKILVPCFKNPIQIDVRFFTEQGDVQPCSTRVLSHGKLDLGSESWNESRLNLLTLSLTIIQRSYQFQCTGTDFFFFFLPSNIWIWEEEKVYVLVSKTAHVYGLFRIRNLFQSQCPFSNFV